MYLLRTSTEHFAEDQTKKIHKHSLFETESIADLIKFSFFFGGGLNLYKIPSIREGSGTRCRRKLWPFLYECKSLNNNGPASHHPTDGHCVEVPRN